MKNKYPVLVPYWVLWKTSAAPPGSKEYWRDSFNLNPMKWLLEYYLAGWGFVNMHIVDGVEGWLILCHSPKQQRDILALDSRWHDYSKSMYQITQELKHLNS